MFNYCLCVLNLSSLPFLSDTQTEIILSRTEFTGKIVNKITKLHIVSYFLLSSTWTSKIHFRNRITYTLSENGATELKSIKCNNPVIPDENSVALWLSYMLRVSEFNKLHSTHPKLPTISTTTHNFV